MPRTRSTRKPTTYEIPRIKDSIFHRMGQVKAKLPRWLFRFSVLLLKHTPNKNPINNPHPKSFHRGGLWRGPGAPPPPHSRPSRGRVPLATTRRREEPPSPRRPLHSRPPPTVPLWGGRGPAPPARAHRRHAAPPPLSHEKSAPPAPPRFYTPALTSPRRRGGARRVTQGGGALSRRR